TTTPAIARPRRETFFCGGDTGSDDMGNSMGIGGPARSLLGRLSMLAVDDTEYDGHEYKRSNSRKTQATNDRAAKWRVLLATLAQAERHRQHADDHRQRGHEHRPEA